jgi:CubicO group peptidase (beta-lactamase class C family)
VIRPIALGLIAFIGCASAAAQEPVELELLKLRIEKAIKDHNVPAIGIALVNRDGPVWVAGWGKANLTTGRAADQDTLFRIGSVTKMFAGLAVLKLVDEGKLSLDDKLRDRAPDLAF